MSVDGAMMELAMAVAREGGCLKEIWLDGVAYDKLSLDVLRRTEEYLRHKIRTEEEMRRDSERYLNGLLVFQSPNGQILVRRASP